MADPPVDEQSPTDVAAAAPAPARGGGADYRRQRHSLAGAVCRLCSAALATMPMFYQVCCALVT